MTTAELIELCVAEYGHEKPRRLTSRLARMLARDQIASVIQPYMNGICQWLVSPHQGETTYAYARRAAVYAAQRANFDDAPPDHAVLQSVAAILAR
jgi:hypothetical protein